MIYSCDEHVLIAFFVGMFIGAVLLAMTQCIVKLFQQYIK